MKKVSIHYITCVMLLTLSFTGFAQERSKVQFNENWKFKLADERSFCESDFDDSQWRDLSLPHDWSVEHEFSKEYSGRNAWLPGGIGWYRKSFEIPSSYQNKHIEIQFDGVYKNASIWINQHPVGTQHDGYTSFRFDITELVNVGESNTIAVRVDNSVQPNCRWYSGSGIYRNVWLNVSNPTHVETWGTYITTPEVSQQEASIHIATSIENMDEAKALTVETSIYDPAGTKITTESTPFKVGRFSRSDTQQKLKITSPKLWSVDTPNIYTAITKLIIKGDIVDEYTSTFGIRTLEFNANKGFFLNGKNMKMKGVCLHHEAGSLGAAVPDEVWVRRLQKLKAIGCNAIRTAHNPTSPEFMTICDTMGFLVMDEFVDKWENAYKKAGASKNPFFDVPFADPNFSTEWRRNYEQTIKRDRNHPSVVIWSVGNENHNPGSHGQNNGLRTIASFVRSLDPTRPVISGMERGRDRAVDENVNAIIESCKYMDLIALNYGEQWCKLIHDKKPGKPYVSTESYAYFNSAPEKRFANIERSPWIDVMENDQNMGLFLWVGVDYLGESKKENTLGTNCGLIDMAGFRKNMSYLYESFWSDKPMVHIEVYEGDADDFSTSGRWWWPPMNQNWNLVKGSAVDVVTYTNCETVDLYLNNKKIGSQKLADFPNYIMKWRKIGHQAGTLKAVGIIGDKAVCESIIQTSGKAHRLKYSVDKKDVKAGDVVHVELKLVDKKGRIVVNNDQRLNFNILGDAKLLAVSNGDMKDMEPFSKTDNKVTLAGKCVCIVKIGKDTKSPIYLNIESDGLKDTKVKISGKQ